MKILNSSLLAISMAGLLCACNPSTSVSTSTGHVASDGKRITLRADGQPNAEISAAGDFSIEGNVQPVTPAQRTLLQAYRTEMNAMTTDGIAIGKQGAALAGTAVTEAIKGAINGDGDKVDGKVKAEARKIEQQAMQLCKRLVTIKASQDAIAAQLPAFKPYATIDVKDVDDCGSNQGDSFAAGKELGGSVAKAVKGEEAADSSDAGNTAAQADAAAAAEPAKESR